MQKKYGDKNLNSIYFGGCTENPNICFVFMNPTKTNIASKKSWKGINAPFLGSKSIWDLFYHLDLLDKEVYEKIKKRKNWTEDFAEEVYRNVKKYKYFITNLAKCTQIDARPLPNEIFEKYVHLLKKEIEIIKPKITILLGNQVSSIILNEKIAVSKVRKKCFIREINKNTYKMYSVYYPIGNGRRNIEKTIEDIKWIIKKEEITWKIQ